MTGPVAQLVALACHFNFYARGGTLRAFFPSNSTCEFCEFVQFVRRKGGILGFGGDIVVCAETPDDWLATERRGDRRAMIVREPGTDPRISDRMSAGFVGGGGTWKLLLISGHRAQAWTATWTVGDRKRTDRKIWRVTYGLVKSGRSVLQAPSELEPTTEKLRSALENILDFARRHDIKFFSSCFEKAISCLSSDGSFSVAYHKDLSPAGLLALSAQQLLAASQAAWVFGGMGSWNDLAFEGDEKKRYDSVSERLFVAVNEAIVRATNSAAKT